MKKIILLLFSSLLIGCGEQQDPESELLSRFDIQTQNRLLMKEKDFIYKHYLTPIPAYLNVLLDYKKRKVQPNQTVPDEFFLSYLYNAVAFFDQPIDPQKCDVSRFTKDEQNLLHEGHLVLSTEPRYFVASYASVVPDFESKNLIINRLLTTEDQKNRLTTRDEIDFNEVKNRRLTLLNRLEYYQNMTLDKAFNPKAIYCLDLNEDDLKKIKSNIQTLFQRYPLTQDDEKKVGIIKEARIN